MPFEVISADTSGTYYIDDSDVVTLMQGVGMTASGNGMASSPGVDQILSSTQLNILGTVVSAGDALNFASLTLSVDDMSIFIGPAAQIVAGGSGLVMNGATGLTFTNDGNIAASLTALDLGTLGDPARLSNTGTLRSTDGAAISTDGGSSLVIDNTGLIAGAGAPGLATIDSGSRLVLSNAGSLLAPGGSAIAISDSTATDDSLRNTGLIDGAVSLHDGADTVTNAGTISGLVALGAGDDRYNGSGDAEAAAGVTGDAGADTLLGGSRADQLDGGDDADLISGRDGGDSLTGGAGDDTILGGPGDDDISGGADGDQINGNAGDDTITGGDARDLLRGGRDDDVIRGGAEEDTIRGDSGDDFILGGPGRDNMFGGSGRDTFIFENLSDSGLGAARDRIYDFRSGEDQLDISLLAGPAFTWLGEGNFTATGDPEVRVVTVPNGTLVYIDKDGDGARDSDIYLIGTSFVTEGDFLL